MVESDEWVAFDRGVPLEETSSLPSKSKYGRSVRNKSRERSSSSGQLPPVVPLSPQLARRKERTKQLVEASSRQEVAEEDALKPEALQSRTGSSSSNGTSTTSETSSQIRGSSEVRMPRGSENRRPPTGRGRSRGRVMDAEQKAPIESKRTRSTSQARKSETSSLPSKTTISAGRSRSITRKGERDRSSSRSRRSTSRTRPPPIAAIPTQHRRSRSQSLKRITSPTAVSPAATAAHSTRSRRGSKPPRTSYNQSREGRGRDSHANHSVGSAPARASARSSSVSSRSRPGSSRRDSNIGIDISFGRSEQPPVEGHSTGSKGRFMERLFGDQVKKRKPRVAVGRYRDSIRPRTLLAATVYHNTATNLWITTINTNQRGVAKNPALANKYLKAFSFPSEREARESAIANAPPKMRPFKASPCCHICVGKFAVFRRASHCRNCGICICKDCAVTWPSKMIPATYNLKGETAVKICKNCDALSFAFKQALVSGDYEEAVALYGTGNVNLRTPFRLNNKKDEVMYPVHCAVLGGNIDVVRWLIDDHFCPIKLVAGKKSRRGGDALILTSKGRSVLSLSLERLKVDVMRYLVVECGVSIYESTDLRSALRALEAALTSLPVPGVNRPCLDEAFTSTRWDKASFDEMSEPSSLGSEDHFESSTVGNKSNRTKRSQRSHGEACIICYERKINCVATPCGHQVCCLQCSSNLSACPVCNNRGDFIKIFRP